MRYKFRAWDKDAGRWALPDDMPINTEGEYFELGGEWLHIMQFTGLKDMNGTEIYEGDRVRFWTGLNEEFLGEVKFVDGCFDIVCENAGKYNTLRDYLKVYVGNHAVKVIGNVYEQSCICGEINARNCPVHQSL